MTKNNFLYGNLQEIDKILRECGADATLFIRAATCTRIECTLAGHQVMMPIRDGGTLLVAYFPSPPPTTISVTTHEEEA